MDRFHQLGLSGLSVLLIRLDLLGLPNRWVRFLPAYPFALVVLWVRFLLGFQLDLWVLLLQYLPSCPAGL